MTISEAMSEMEEFKRKLRIASYDIETTGLNADFGYVFCVCFKRFGGETITFRIDDKRNPDKTSDKWVIEQTIKYQNEELDVVVSYNGLWFDSPFIKSRMLVHRLKEYPNPIYHRDLYHAAKSNTRFRRKSLLVIESQLFERQTKTHMTPTIWVLAIRGLKPALDYIVDHCKKDVALTEKVYQKFMPFLGPKLRRHR